MRPRPMPPESCQPLTHRRQLRQSSWPWMKMALPRSMQRLQLLVSVHLMLSNTFNAQRVVSLTFRTMTETHCRSFSLEATSQGDRAARGAGANGTKKAAGEEEPAVAENGGKTGSKAVLKSGKGADERKDDRPKVRSLHWELRKKCPRPCHVFCDISEQAVCLAMLERFL